MNSKIRLFDSHCHLQDERIAGHITESMALASRVGVCQMVCCGSAENDWDKVQLIGEHYSSVSPSFGYHPWFISQRSKRWTDHLRTMLDLCKSAGVGEIGLDHSLDSFDPCEQNEVFIAQLEIAKEYNRPVSIHCRKAWGMLIDILEKTGLPAQGGCLHSYSGSPELVSRIENLGLHLSFSGSITYERNKRGREALRLVSDKRLLVETDSPDILPYGAPDGPNCPSHLRLIAQIVADLRGATLDALSELTFENAKKLFLLDPLGHAMN